jgi:putative addiction module component (TIGR02574 family)
MTKLLEKALAAAQRLPPDEQDELARAILGMIDADAEPHILSDQERAAIERSRAAAERGEFATDEQVRAVLSKYS